MGFLSQKYRINHCATQDLTEKFGETVSALDIIKPMAGNQTLKLDEFFAGFSESRVLYDHLQRLMNRIGPSESFVSKSQIAFHRKKSFAWIWTPGKYLRGKTAPLVFSLSFHQPDPSSRWKEITDTGNGWFMHHLELYSRLDINAEVAGWLQKAWEQAA